MTQSGDENPQETTQPAPSRLRRNPKLPTIIVIIVFYVVLFGICMTGMLIAFIAAQRV